MPTLQCGYQKLLNYQLFVYNLLKRNTNIYMSVQHLDNKLLTSAILWWSDVDFTNISELKFSWHFLSLQFMIILFTEGKLRCFRMTFGFSFNDMVEISNVDSQPNLLVSFSRCSRFFVSSTTKCFCFWLCIIVKGIFLTPIFITEGLVSFTGRLCVCISCFGIAPGKKM